MNLTIRAANPDDAAVICEFNRLLAKETENKDLDWATIQAGVHAMLKEPTRGRYYVAEIQGQVAGQLGLTFEWSDWRNGDFWWIQSVYVAKHARRMGVFRQLYEHLLQEARSTPRVIGIRLYVEHENVIAQATYRKLGLAMTHYHVMEKHPL